MNELRRAVSVIRSSSVLWWRDWLVLAALNLAWVVAWVTLLLGPPATFALYRAAQTVVRGEPLDFRDLVRDLRRDFLKSWLWGLVTLGVSLVIWLTVGFYGQLAAGWTTGLQFVSLLVGMFWLALGLYTLPYLLEGETASLRQAFRNALFTLLASPVYTAVLTGFAWLLLYLGSRFVFLFFLGLPCLIAVLGTVAVQERLTTFKIRRREDA